MDKHDRFTKRLLQASERSYWLGAAAGLAGGYLMGYLVQGDLGSAVIERQRVKSLGSAAVLMFRLGVDLAATCPSRVPG